MVLVVVAFTVSTSVAAESHPAALVKCAVCVPAAAKLNPFQMYGNADGQMLILVVDVVGWVMIRFNVAVLSQPAALVVLYV